MEDYPKKEKLQLQFLEAEVPIFAFVPFRKPFVHLGLVLWRRDNDLVTRLPVCRGGYAVFVGGLQGFTRRIISGMYRPAVSG